MAQTSGLTKNEEQVYRDLYDNDLFIEQINEEFKCSICLSVLREPQQLITCGHLYCKVCITSYFQSAPQNNLCPMDRRPATLADILPAPRAICALIEGFQVKCRNFEDGCTARMVLKELDKHNILCRFGAVSGLCGEASGVSNLTDKVAIEVSALPLTIYVKLADQSKTAIITASSDDNVLTLKRRIREKEGLDVDTLILNHGSKPLADDRKLLVEYNIKNGSVVFSSRRFNGGDTHLI